jgi:plastocyanin
MAIHVKTAGGGSLSNAVVYATPEGEWPGDHPRPEPPDAVIDQVDREFVPFVSAVPTGTRVHFPNSDNIHHHVYSFSPAKRFELPLYADQPQAPVLFDQPGLVALGCNIHDDMLAYLYVVDTPHVAVTGGDGAARLADLPAGPYRVQVWHPLLKDKEEPVRRVTVAPGDDLRLDIELNLKRDWRPKRRPTNYRSR